jgi:glycosyltransferase involved in cell wall biosynthesis
VHDDTVAGTVEALQRWLELSADQREQMGFRAEQLFRQMFNFASVSRNLLPVLEAAVRHQDVSCDP